MTEAGLRASQQVDKALSDAKKSMSSTHVGLVDKRRDIATSKSQRF